MRKGLRSRFLVLIAITAVAIMMVAGCEEEEVFSISQDEELQRFITDSEDGQELFGPLQVASSWTYSFPGVDTVYTDIVDSVTRSITVTTGSDSLLDLGIGEYYFGRATVRDNIFGRTQKTSLGNTTQIFFMRPVEREGFLVKLGDNSQPYSGWLLCGFNGGPTMNLLDISVGGQTLDNSYANGVTVGTVTLPGTDFPYKDMEEIISIDKGAQIVLDGCPDCIILTNYQSSSGFITENLTEGLTDSLCLNDTLQTASTTDRLWSYLFVVSICKMDSNYTYVDQSVIPYRLNQ